MPNIPPEALDSVFYLYASKADAEAGRNLGGTGFFIGVPLEVGYYIYAVTNWHVAVRDGFSVIRLNTKDGKTDTIELDSMDWIYKRNWHDLAIADVSLDYEKHKTHVITTDATCNSQDIEGGRIGPGADVFMVGRFVDHDGGITNQPAVRWGHISVMPVVIDKAIGGDGMPSYLLDMHSRGGYSGSPVFVYQSALELKGKGTLTLMSDPGFPRLLAVHSGQFFEDLEIHSKKRKLIRRKGKGTRARMVIVPDPAKQFVKGWSGMTFAVPAQAIMELIDVPKLKAPRDRVIEELRIKQSGGPVPESAAPPTTDENPRHREDFSRLLNAAARGSKPSPETA